MRCRIIGELSILYISGMFYWFAQCVDHLILDLDVKIFKVYIDK